MDKIPLATPPVITRPDTLPLLDPQISWERFERFIRHLIRVQPGVRQVKRYGKLGSKQKGIDLIATLENADCWVYQCKQCSRYTLDDAKKAVAKTTYPAKKYFLVIACQTDSAVHDYVDAQANWELWDADRVSDEVLRLLPEAGRDLVSRFFGSDWCKAFLGIPSSNQSTERKFPRPYSTVARPRGKESILTREELYEEDFKDGKVVCPSAWQGVLEEARKGRIVAVQAPPGSGKSTLAAWIDWKLSQRTHVEYLPGRGFQNLPDTALLEALNGLPDETVVLIDDAHLVQRHLDQLMRSSIPPKMRFLLLSRPGGFVNVPGIPPPLDLSTAAHSIAQELVRQYTSTPEEATALLSESHGDLVFTKWLLGARQEHPSQSNPTLDSTVLTKLKEFWDIHKELLRLVLVLSAYRWLELSCPIRTLTGSFGFESETIETLERLKEATLDFSGKNLSLDRHPKLAGRFTKVATEFRYYFDHVLEPTCAALGISPNVFTNSRFSSVLLGAAVAKRCVSATEVVDRFLLSKLHGDCVDFSHVATHIELLVNGPVDCVDPQTVERRLAIAFAIYDAMRRTEGEAKAWTALSDLRERLGVTGTPEIDFARKGYLLYQIGSHYLLINDLDEALKQLANAAEADDRWARHTANSKARFTGAACMSRILALRATADVLLATADGAADPRPDLNTVRVLAERLEAESSNLHKLMSESGGMDWLWICRWHRNALCHLAELRGCLNEAKAVAELTEKAVQEEAAIKSQFADEVAAQVAQAHATLEFVNSRFEHVVSLLQDIPWKQLKGGERTGRPAQLLAISERNLGNLQKFREWCSWLADECPVDKANRPAVAWAKAVLYAQVAKRG